MESPDKTKINNTEQVLSELGAVVLCGGKSTRLGIDKTQLIFRGQTFLERVVEQVGKVANKISIVGEINFEAHDLPSNVVLLTDENPTAGPLEGMRVGLKSLSESCEYAFVTSCDVPLLKPELIRFLHRELDSQQAIVPFQDQRIFGMTAVYRTSLFPEIAKRIAGKKLRVSDLSSAFDAKMIDVKELTSVDLELDSMTNVNSADDYFDLLKRFGMECVPELAHRLNRVKQG